MISDGDHLCGCSEYERLQSIFGREYICEYSLMKKDSDDALKGQFERILGKKSQKRKKAKKPKINYRRLASIQLAQLRRIAIYLQCDCGEILDVEIWLEVMANILSSAPPCKEWIGRKPVKIELGLSNQSLTKACVDFRLTASQEQIRRQVRETSAWRQKMSAIKGRSFFVPMKMDTIGKRLGITEEVRQATEAWNIGTYDGSKKQRATAALIRDKFRQRNNREIAGATPRSKSLTALKPWAAYGVSRRTWERWRALDYLSDSECKQYSQAKDVASSSVVNSSKTNKDTAQIHPEPILVQENAQTLRAPPSRQDTTDQRLGGQKHACDSSVLTDKAEALNHEASCRSKVSVSGILCRPTVSSKMAELIQLLGSVERANKLLSFDLELDEPPSENASDELW
jgi:hypothetical protein